MQKISETRFEAAIRDLYEFMGKKTPPPARTVNLWYEKVMGIREDDLLDAIDSIKDDAERIPNNIVRAIKIYVAINKSSKGIEKKWVNHGICDGCNSSGLFVVLSFHNNHKKWYRSIKYCLQCENWKNYCNNPGEMATKAMLKNQGYRFKPGNMAYSTTELRDIGYMPKAKKISASGLRQLTNNIGKQI